MTKHHVHLPTLEMYDIVLMLLVANGYEMIYGSNPSLCIEASTSRLKFGGSISPSKYCMTCRMAGLSLGMGVSIAGLFLAPSMPHEHHTPL